MGCKIWGEEFLVCLPNADKNKSIEIAERMRKKIENKIFEFGDIIIKATTSFGVHTSVANDESSILSLINSADKNLYRAKEKGRNRVMSS